MVPIERTMETILPQLHLTVSWPCFFARNHMIRKSFLRLERLYVFDNAEGETLSAHTLMVFLRNRGVGL